MACGKHSSCETCTFRCGYWFLTMDDMTTICLKDPGMLGVGAIGMQNNYKMCYLVDPTTSRTTTMGTSTTITSTSTTRQPQVTASAFLPIFIGCIGLVGFLIACGGMIYCWVKKRRNGRQLYEVRSLLRRRPNNNSETNFRQSVENRGFVAIPMGNLTAQNQTETTPSLSASNVTEYDLPSPAVQERNELQSPIRAVSHVTTVWDSEGRAHIAETKF